jgi:sugar phosphate isomerase/epimerase
MVRAALGPDDLVAAYYTLARADRHGDARISFPDRVRAASRAGFAGIGVQPHDHARSLAAGLSEEEMADLLDSAGVVLAEIDGAPWWPANDGSEAELESAQREAVRVATAFGADHIVAAMPAIDDPTPIDDLAGRLALLADRAAPEGIRVGLEFLPWTPVRTVAQAQEIVARADRENLGITFDFWHHSAGGGDLDMLRAVAGEEIVAVHFTDGRRDPTLDPLSETMVGRRLPGEGEFDLGGLVRTLDAIGVRGPITVELVSLAHRQLSVDELAVLVHDGVRAALSAARGTPGGKTPTGP